jgi:hypothetical protein
MNEAQFRQRARVIGYGECPFEEFAPNVGGPLHTHEISVMLLVVHAERTGSAGASVPPGRKSTVASHCKWRRGSTTRQADRIDASRQ